MYCKPTHTEQYLQWDSYHSLSAKYSVIGTLTHRAKVVFTDPELLHNELNHLRRALVKFNYPTWVFNKVQNKVLNNNWVDTYSNNSTNTNNNNIQAKLQTQGKIVTAKHTTTTIKPTIKPQTDMETRPQ